MKEINIGKMNKKIYICTPRTIQDEMGQDIMTYEKGKRIWATVKSVRGGEYYDALKLSPEVSYIIIQDTGKTYIQIRSLCITERNWK